MSTSNNTSGNVTTVDCLGGVLFAYTELQISIEIIVVRFVCICLVLRKMLMNYDTFIIGNRFWLGFFSLMNVGNIIYVIVYCMALYATTNANLLEVDAETNETVSIAIHIGTLFVDTFFGLLPNFFYYFYKIHINQDDRDTHKKILMANAIVISIFFVVIFVMSIVLIKQDGAYPTDIIIAVEMLYIFGMHVLSLRIIKTVVSRIEKLLQWFTLYVTVYAILVILRSIFLIVLNSSTVFSYSSYTAVMILERLVDACLVLVLVLMMKDIKIGSSSQEKSSDIKETTTEL